MTDYTYAQYDNLDRRTEVLQYADDASLYTEAFTYDAEGRLRTVTTPDHSLGYGYSQITGRKPLVRTPAVGDLDNPQAIAGARAVPRANVAVPPVAPGLVRPAAGQSTRRQDRGWFLGGESFSIGLVWNDDDEQDDAELPEESIFPLDADARFMIEAIKEAQAAADIDEVPVGAVIVHQGRIIARAHNQRHTLKDPTAHAEMIALTQAANHLEDWRLNGCTLYVTLEPCPMCAGAMVLARVDRLVYGPADPKAGACESLYRICDDGRLNHRLEIVRGFMEQPCRLLLQDFFARKRKEGKK